MERLEALVFLARSVQRGFGGIDVNQLSCQQRRVQDASERFDLRHGFDGLKRGDLEAGTFLGFFVELETLSNPQAFHPKQFS